MVLLYQIILFVSYVLEGSVTTARTAFVPTLVRPRQQIPRVARAVASTEPSTGTDHKAPPALAPLVDIPMKRLKLPRFAVGREYVIVPLKIQGKGPFEFMLDTGLTVELITPHLKRTLLVDSDATKPVFVEGLAAGGTTAKEKLVELSGASICDEEKELELPTLHAVVTDFSQEHMDPRHDPVEGMLGMEMLELFDVDFDFPAGRIRFWAPGTAAEEAKRAGLVEIPAAIINESLLLGTRVTGKPSTGKTKPIPKQPFIGIIDSGSTFSAVNWEAAKLLDLPPKSNILKYLSSPAIMGIGVDGKPLPMPTKKVKFSFCGNATANKKGEIVEFAAPPPQWQPWKPVLVGIGDLPLFELVLGSDKAPFHGPAAVIGMDVLSQRRVILEACRDTNKCTGRSRRMFVSPK